MELDVEPGNRLQLMAGIIELSVSKIWGVAKLEWDLDYIFWNHDGTNCLCGHYPIKEVCVLLNNLNGNTAIVGNVCVNRFVGIASNKLFDGINKIRKRIDKAANYETIGYVFNKKWINSNSYSFYCNTLLKRKLSPKQMLWRISINRTILRNIDAK
jgi:hypothetical protein